MPSPPRANALDRVLSYLSPARGLARSQARAAMGAILAYDGARSDRRTDGWLTGTASGDAETGAYHRTMRERARDLVRNNPHAMKGLSVIVANKIGSGIMAQPSGKNARRNERLNELWKRWIDNCDATGRHDLYGIQSLAERTRAESGESLVRIIPTAIGKRGDVPFRLQVLEPDYLDSDRNTQLSETSSIRYGVEYAGRIPVAYWLFDTHPGDAHSIPGGRGWASKRVPAAEIIHNFKVLRPGQVRGMTDFASVILRLRALDDYDDAEVMRKKIAACMAAFVTSPAGLPGASLAATTTDAAGNRIEQFRPGMVGYLKPGEGVVFSDPRPSIDYQAFNKVQLHAIAAGLAMPYELLTGDLSEVTYTSHRGGLVQFRGMVEADQWQTVIPQICQPITRRFTEEAVGVDAMIDPETPWTYTPPRFGLLDPSKEIPAMVASIESGIDSYPNVIRREGYDWREKLDEIEDFQEEVKRRGISLTSIPTVAPVAVAPVVAPSAPEVEDENAQAA